MQDAPGRHRQLEDRTLATTLTKTARTILKSRLRRHPDALLIAQHIEGTYSKTNVSDLATSELVETAGRFGAAMIPTADEADAFDAAKAA